MMDKLLPHEGVFVRLGISKIHGIGVFAGQPIKAGTNIFASDQREISWLPRSVMHSRRLNDFQRSFYEDFAIRRGEELGCPTNFNMLTVGWYVNEPPPGEEPNLTAVVGYELVAARNIGTGEELTIRYSSFDELKP